MENKYDLMSILSKVNVMSQDNEVKFIKLSRLKAINKLLTTTQSPYIKERKEGLSIIYRHKEFPWPPSVKSKAKGHFLIISSHIDSLYPRHFTKDYSKTELLGTFDNSITNAVILFLMVNRKLPKNILVAFTGDEENEGKGAKETAVFLTEQDGIQSYFEFAITLDVSNCGYGKYPCTVFIKSC